MKTLYEEALCASLRNMDQIVWKCYLLPKKVLFALVRACLEEPPIVLAFANLVKHWPLANFSVHDIGIRLKDEDVLLLASLIQKRQFGCIQLFNFLDIKFGILSDRATNAILNAILDNKSVLSVKKYLSHDAHQTSRSFGDALSYACKSLFSVQPNSYLPQFQTFSPNIHSQLLRIVMEFVINNMNVGKYMSLVEMQKCNILSYSVIISRIKFDYISTPDIIKVLRVTNRNDLVGVDLSFNCLGSPMARLKSVCHELKVFTNLEMLNFSYNNITSNEIHLLTDLLANLHNLHYLDLSGNILKSGINSLLEVGIQTECLKTLILTGCCISDDSLRTLVLCKNISNLHKLKLDQNEMLSKNMNLFVELLQKFSHSLIYLDISGCHISKEAVIELCPIFSSIKYLEVLVLWPNPGINETTITRDILPLLTLIPNVNLPPIRR